MDSAPHIQTLKMKLMLTESSEITVCFCKSAQGGSYPLCVQISGVRIAISVDNYDQWVHAQAHAALHEPKVIAKSAEEIEAEGAQAEVRLPCYTTHTRYDHWNMQGEAGAEGEAAEVESGGWWGGLKSGVVCTTPCWSS